MPTQMKRFMFNWVVCFWMREKIFRWLPWLPLIWRRRFGSNVRFGDEWNAIINRSLKNLVNFIHVHVYVQDSSKTAPLGVPWKTITSKTALFSPSTISTFLAFHQNNQLLSKHVMCKFFKNIHGLFLSQATCLQMSASMLIISIIFATTSQIFMVFQKSWSPFFHFWVKHLGNFPSG
jgi:hypothetical protein